ncbi:hypothetical protein COLO4_28724 [Corchorus olitorius]|uniref:Transposase-associated domain-containing protein n=1 Tax=Corchorus olitorius TaxID=93759 RepID=A0A1R3HIT9_9ROSI|nr:hypothetical protein COLO4_28724 [Corchorus olitorius]
MDKSWIHEENRCSGRYLEGLAKFLEFALKSSSDGELTCPCIKCGNRYRLSKNVVTDHILQNGFSQSYINWVFHGEPIMESTHYTPSPLHHGHYEVNTGHNVGQFLNDMIVGGGFNSSEDNQFFVISNQMVRS